jgi:hypothetical protein
MNLESAELQNESRECRMDLESAIWVQRVLIGYCGTYEKLWNGSASSGISQNCF